MNARQYVLHRSPHTVDPTYKPKVERRKTLCLLSKRERLQREKQEKFLLFLASHNDNNNDDN